MRQIDAHVRRHTHVGRIIAWCGLAIGVLASPLDVEARGVVVRGRVVDEQQRPVPHAVVQAVRLPSGPAADARAGTDGSFTVELPDTGSYAFFAVAPARDMTRIGPIHIGDRGLNELYLTLGAASTRPGDLGTATLHASDDAISGDSYRAPEAESTRYWSRPVPNPRVTHFAGHDVTLRAVSAAAATVAVLSIVCGIAWLLRSGERASRRQLSSKETADFVMNDGRPAVGPRLRSHAVGARGMEWTFSVDADRMREYLAAQRVDLVASWIVLGTLVATAVVGLGLAILIGQPRYLLIGVALIAATFAVMPWLILWQAVRPPRA